MDRLESKPGGDLGKVEPAIPDHPPGGLNLQIPKVLHHPAAGVGMEQLLQLTAADEIVPADLFQGEWTVQVLLM